MTEETPAIKTGQRRAAVWGLWVSTILILLTSALQGLSGHWILFFAVWPGGPNPGPAFVQAMTTLTHYHIYAGFATGWLAVFVLVFAFIAKTNKYVRIFAVVGFILTVIAASGGVLYVRSGLQDRWSVGQMADAFVGVFGAYFIQLFFMNKIPRFPWNRAR